MKRFLQCLPVLAGLAFTSTADADNFYKCSTDRCSWAGWNLAFSSYAKTKYPIVLAHGMGGFSQLGPLDYWYGIPADLATNGANVYITQVASFSDSVTRGEQLLQQVKQIQAITGAPKVNLVAHSQGTLDSRYVAAVAPSLIASVTGVGGPNTGSPVADVVEGVASVIGPMGTDLVASIVNGFFIFVDTLSGKTYEQDALAGLHQLSTTQMAAFNAAYPAGLPASATPCGQGAATVNGIRYFSWGGTGVSTNLLDVSDLALGLTTLAFNGLANDGLVGQCSSHLGTVIRDNYNMNHLDEVNQVMGLVALNESSPVALFRAHANRLKNAGL
ncbi:MAG TPA: triacylglycerol lipase [Moraxellaceae bacterium]|nr:triacylglycerol lipase [Moraxellaceae bacterium]